MSWVKPELKRLGNVVKNNNIRVSMHPSQMCVINSPKSDVVKNSVKDLIYHYNILNLMGLDDFNIIIHVGGVYGDKAEAMKRFVNIFNRFPEKLKQHIILENDDKSYTINDVMKIHSETGLKVCLDYHHHVCNNDCLDLDLGAIFGTWGDVIPKIHVSSPKSDKEFRSHSYVIDFSYCKDFFISAKSYEFDVMLECNDKDLAIDKFISDYRRKVII